MYPYFLFQVPLIGQLSIPAYSLFAFIGLFFAMVFFYLRLQKKNIAFSRFLILMAFMITGVALGSKALFIITQIPEIIRDFSLQKTFYIIWTSGFVFYGGMFGAIVGAYLFTRFFHLPSQAFIDLLIPGFPLFHFWGRIGCFFAGCCYGKVSTWGFPLYGNPHVLHIPVQLFEALCLCLIFTVFLLFEKRGLPAGRLTILYLFSYSICRFALEFFRGDTIRGIWFGLSTSQWISLGIVLFTVHYLFKAKPWKNYKISNLYSTNN